MNAPTPDVIRAARAYAGQTQAQAAHLIGLGAAPRWAEFEAGRSPIDPARWTLYLLLTDQHPELRVVRRRATAAASPPAAPSGRRG